MTPNNAKDFSNDAAFLKDNERLRFAMNAAGIGVWEMDTKTNTVIWDHRCRELFGLAKDNAIPYQEAIRHIHPDDVAEVNRKVQAAIGGEAGGLYDATYRTIGADDGQLRWVNFTGTAYFDGDSQLTRFGGVARNVTESHAAQQKNQESETRFRSLVESSPVAICLFTGKGSNTIAVANEAMLKIWGKNGSAIGKPLLEAVPELAGQLFPALLDGIYDSGQPVSGRGAPAQLRVDGVMSTYYFDFIYQPLYDADGKVYGILDIAVDVTEQVLARQKVDESEASLKAAVNLAQLGTWKIDLPTNKVTFSERLQKWLGTEGFVLKLEDFSYVHPGDCQRVATALKAATVPGEAGEFNEVFKITHGQSGKTRSVHALGRTIFGAGGEALSVAGTAQDITIQRELQLALELEVQTGAEELAAVVEELRATNEELGESNLRLLESNKQLLRSNEELAQYAYVASHDLQEPLRKIQVFASVLGNSYEIPASLVPTIRKIQKSSNRMTELIKDLLGFSQLLKSDSLFEPVDLNKIVQDVESDYDVLIKEKKASLHIEALPVIEAVPFQMQQLFFNLIGNALKFAKTDAEAIIRISCNEENKKGERSKSNGTRPVYHITVSDNGIGFSQEHAQQIFEVFKRLHGREHYAGTGIGLALCKRIVENHKGTIRAESRPDEGAQFHIRLPGSQP